MQYFEAAATALLAKAYQGLRRNNYQKISKIDAQVEDLTSGRYVKRYFKINEISWDKIDVREEGRHAYQVFDYGRHNLHHSPPNSYIQFYTTDRDKQIVILLEDMEAVYESKGKIQNGSSEFRVRYTGSNEVEIYDTEIDLNKYRVTFDLSNFY
ncbi:MAG TPA: hypothetical protein VD999_06155 [Vitreimonas sp.]|nr:hypothetical protein [Vitreimonas sp.]